MRVLSAIVAALTLLTAPTVVTAQVNYELLAGYGNGGRSLELLVSRRTNSIIAPLLLAPRLNLH
jgi:hypothetical protein